MKEFKSVKFSDELPEVGMPTFVILNDDELCVLEYQGEGYPLYDRSSYDTVPYHWCDYWLKEVTK